MRHNFCNQGASGTIMRLNSGGRLDGIRSNKMRPTIQTKIERIFQAGQISRREHLDLTSALLADHSITDRDRFHINQVIEFVQSGKLKLID